MIDKYGDTLGVYFLLKRNRYAAYEFLKRVLKPYCSEQQPKALNTDKHSAYGHAITRWIKEGKLLADVQQRQIKTLNNRTESNHTPIEKLIVATAVLNQLNVLGVKFKGLILCVNWIKVRRVTPIPRNRFSISGV